MRSGVQDQPGQYGETLNLLKIKKLAGHGGVHLQSQLLWRLRKENCLSLEGGSCSEPRLRHCTPAWVTERDSASKNKERYNNSELNTILHLKLKIQNQPIFGNSALIAEHA